MGLTDVLAGPTTDEDAMAPPPSGPKGHSRESSTSSAASSSGASSCGDDPDALVPASSAILLEARLEETRAELERSRAECGRLAQIRDDVEAEVRELTASLFQVRFGSPAHAHR